MQGFNHFLRSPILQQAMAHTSNEEQKKRGRDDDEGEVSMSEDSTAAAGAAPVTPAKKNKDGEEATMDFEQEPAGDEGVEEGEIPEDEMDTTQETGKGDGVGTTAAEEEANATQKQNEKTFMNLFNRMGTKNGKKSAGTTETYAEAASAAPGKEATHSHSTWCHAQINVQATKAPSIVVRSEVHHMWASLLEHDNVICILPIAKRVKKKLTSPSLFPKKHDELKKYLTITNKPEDLMREIKGKKGKDFSLIFQMGTDKALEESDIISVAIDLSESGFQFEIKRFQAERSEEGILAVLLSSHIPLPYLQTQLQACIISAVREANREKGAVRRSMLEEQIKKGTFQILVNRKYAPHYFSRYVDGAPRVDTLHKKIVSIEYNSTIACELKGLTPLFKRHARLLGLGEKAMFILPKESDEPGYTRYKDYLENHQMYNVSLSSVELPHMSFINTPVHIGVEEPGANATEPVTLLQLLMKAKTPTGQVVFSAIFPTASGHTGMYHNIGDRMDAAHNIAQHPPSWTMYELIVKHGMRDGTRIHNFLSQCFPTAHVKLAENCSQYNPESTTFSMIEAAGLEDEDDVELRELQQEAWFDMSLVRPAVTHGSMAAGIAFNPDDNNSTSSMTTRAWMASEYGPTAGMQGYLASLSGNNQTTSATSGQSNAQPSTTATTQSSNTESNSAGTSSANLAGGTLEEPSPGDPSVVRARG